MTVTSIVLQGTLLVGLSTGDVQVLSEPLVSCRMIERAVSDPQSELDAEFLDVPEGVRVLWAFCIDPEQEPRNHE